MISEAPKGIPCGSARTPQEILSETRRGILRGMPRIPSETPEGIPRGTRTDIIR